MNYLQVLESIGYTNMTSIGLCSTFAYHVMKQFTNKSLLDGDPNLYKNAGTVHIIVSRYRLQALTHSALCLLCTTWWDSPKSKSHWPVPCWRKQATNRNTRYRIPVLY
jgi:hypothetical protein